MLETMLLFCDCFLIMSDKTIDIDYVAKLARIELTDEERVKYSAQLEQILDYFKKLSAVDVEGVEPSAHAHSIYNVWREDVPTAGMSIDDALLNAPAKRENQIVVPKVVDDA
jgi:aspartyl-tRNA(Asn)/glutamyl-tRNA(Gln) amidotransferase subunit C